MIEVTLKRPGKQDYTIVLTAKPDRVWCQEYGSSLIAKVSGSSVGTLQSKFRNIPLVAGLKTQVYTGDLAAYIINHLWE